MKKNIIAKLILVAAFMTASTALMAQVPPPPPGGGHGQGTNQPAGGDAPIGGGIAILLTLGAAYGAKKMYDLRNKSEV